MEIRVKKLYEDALLPTKGSVLAAGWDLYAHLRENEMLIIKPHETVKIGTGIAVAAPHGYFGGIAARSGLATKQDLAPANKFGIVDEDYRGEVIVALHNHGDIERGIRNGDRIAQLIFIPYAVGELIETESLEDTERGEGGFGSSGV